jgi:hypothetical protein
MPFILHHMQLIEKVTPEPKRVTFDIRPDNSIAVIKQHDQDKHKVVSFIPYDALVAMKTNIFSFAPEYFTDDIYHEHIQMAYKKVQKFSNKKVKTKKKETHSIQIAAKN